VIRVYHGGLLNRSSDSLWASSDADYAAAFAQLYEGALWMLTLDVADGEVLDLTDCGLDVSAVVTDLMFAGIPARVKADDERKPHKVLCGVPPDAIRAAGYRVVRICDWINWGAGERHAESVLIVDLTAIFDREVLPLENRNYQFPEDHETKPLGAGLVCPHCQQLRSDVVTATENRITFRCDGCGYRWSTEEPGTSRR
jgi:hypothetical protein